MPSWTLLFIKTSLFPQRGSDPAYLASMYFMVLDASTVAAGANFCHTSPVKRLGAEWPLFFSPWGHDSASAILDLNFSNLHRVFGAMIPMVRRTGGFGAAKSGFKTN